MQSKLTAKINKQLQARYDRIAPSWNSDVYAGTRRDDLIPKLITLLEVQAGSLKVLEAMAGTALVSQELKKQNSELECYALDFSQGMLAQIKGAIKKIQASATVMPFADKSFDRICIRNGLYDLPRQLQRKALKEIKRVLSVDGIFVLQNYHTTLATFEYLNELVKQKDIAGSQNKAIEEPFSRYFAPIEEFEGWLNEAGFEFSREMVFEGEIRYMRTKEMSDTESWLKYANSLPKEIEEVLKMRTEKDRTLTFNFPGIIYRMIHKTV